MKILICLVVVALMPLRAAKNELTWEPAKVESTICKVLYGANYVRYDPSRMGEMITVHESIYVDAGEWLYHVSREVMPRGMMRLPDGTKIDVAVDGKTLLIRVGGKRYSAKIEEKSRAGAAASPASSRR